VTPAPLTAAAIQADLDTDGYCKLPPGRHVLDRTITIRQRQRLEGSGPATVLYAPPPLDAAIVFGDETQVYTVASYVSNLTLTGAGMRFYGMSNHSAVDHVWVQGARGHAFDFTGTRGELIDVGECVAWGNAGDGFHVETTTVNTGITFTHCTSSANRGAGVALETRGPTAVLQRVTLVRCVIQGNGLGGEADAEIVIRGRVNMVHLDGCWSENPPARQVIDTLILTQPRWEWAGTHWIRTRPANLVIDGFTALELARCILRAEACYGIEIGRYVTGPGVVELAGDWWDVRKDQLRGEWWEMHPDQVQIIDIPIIRPSNPVPPDGGPATSPASEPPTGVGGQGE
jgi:hypothetical protein